MIAATWKFKSLYKADAQAVAEEIIDIGDNATPAQILEKAKDANTQLHLCFTWDNNQAAEKWRLFEARQIVCNLVIKKTSDENDLEEVTNIRLFHKTDNSGYKPLTLILRNEEEYEKLVRRCADELSAIKKKYSHLSEFEEIWELIN